MSLSTWETYNWSIHTALNLSTLDAGSGSEATSKNDNVLTEHGGLLHVLPLTVHLRLFLLEK